MVTVARNGHYKVTHPETGRSIQFPYSASDWRSLMNVCQTLRNRLGFKHERN